MEEILANVVMQEDGIHVVDQDGTIGPVCTKLTSDGYYILTPNAANRKCLNKAKTDAYFVENPNGEIPLTYKATRTFDGTSSKLPNAKLIAYLDEELQAEYKAIIDRAIEAKNAAKAQPMTELEKAQAKVKKAQEALAKLLAQAEGTEEVDE